MKISIPYPNLGYITLIANNINAMDFKIYVWGNKAVPGTPPPVPSPPQPAPQTSPPVQTPLTTPPPAPTTPPTTPD